MRIACLMMQKDEVDLLEPWLAYHANLFGAENLYVWDNGSTELAVADVLTAWRDHLGALTLDLSAPEDFRRKGVILGEKIKVLDALQTYDFFLPIDCDEFIMALDGGVPSFGQEIICKELEGYANELQALGIGTAFYNLPGRQDEFWMVGFRKTLFRASTFKQMDHGYHQGESRLAPGIRPTNLAYMHLHHKPHAQIKEHSRNKLAAYYDVNNQELLNTLYKSNRLARFMIDSEEEYLKTFEALPAVYVPEFRRQFDNLGVRLPNWV